MGKQNSCLSLDMIKTPEFQELKKRYPDYDDGYLLDALEEYREQFCDGNDDYYPVSPGQRSAFTRFLNRKRSSDAPVVMKSEMTEKELLDTYVSMSRAFPPKIRNFRINMITNDFLSKIRMMLQRHPDLTVKQIIDKFGGYEKIMNSVFKGYEEMASVDYWLDEYPIEAEEGTEEYEKAMEAYRVSAHEYSLVVENRKRLIAMAAPRLSSIIGQRIDFDTLVAESDIDDVYEEPVVSDNPEGGNGTEGDDATEDNRQKGDRYEDVRKKLLSQTLATQVKVFLEGIPMVDQNGEQQTDDLGNPLFLGYETVASALSGEFQSVEAEDFMDALNDLSEKYPWVKDLHDSLVGNIPMQTAMFNNFKTYQHLYKSIRKVGRSYEMDHLNRRSNRRSVMQEAGKNIVDGRVLNWDYTIYDGSGKLTITKDKADKIIERLKKFSKWLEHVKTKTTAPSYAESTINKFKATQPWIELRGKAAMQKFLEAEGVDEWLEVVAHAAQGVGFNVTKKNIADMAVKTIDKRTARRDEFRVGNNRLEIFVNALAEAYQTAVKTVDMKEDANYFYSVSSDNFKKMTDTVALALTKEVENRVHVGDSTIATHTTGGYLQWICDKLFNKGGMSRTTKGEGSHIADDGETYVPNVEIGEYERWLQDNFFKFEGFVLEATGKPIGWLWDLWCNRERIDGYDGAMSKYAGPTALVTEVEFNGVPYEKLSDDQRKLAAFLMWYKVANGERIGNYVVSIESDYTAAWDYIQAPIYETGTKVHDLAVELVGDPESDRVQETENKLRQQLKSDRTPVMFKVGNETRYSEIVYRFADEIRLEHERILNIEEREKQPHVVLKNYEKAGKKFLVFPEFQVNGFREEYERLLDTDVAAANEFLYQQVAIQLNKIVEEDIKEFTKGDIPKNTALPSTQYEKMFDKNGNLTPFGRGLLQQFSLNSYYADLQEINIFLGGLAHFGNISALEKRSMMFHATRSAMYTVAGKKDQRVAYVKDDKTKSAALDEMIQLIKKAEKRGLISHDRALSAIAAYESIKSTDGQGLRTLPSYRQFRKMNATSQWTEAHEEAYQRLMNGEAKAGDLDLILDEDIAEAYNQTIKPITTGWESCPTIPGQKPVRVPLLHKYSEAVLLPPTILGESFSMQSAQMQAFNKFNDMLSDDEKFDLFLFESNVKIEPFSVFDPFAIGKDGERLYKTADEMAQYMYDTYSGNRHYGHVIPYVFTGVSASMTAHGSSTSIAFSTQAEKQTMANVEDADDVRVPGHTFNGKEARDHYDKIECAIIADSFQDVVKELGDADGTAKVLRHELGSKAYNSPEIAMMLTPVRDGKGNTRFAAPIFSPTTSRKAQELLSSMMNNRLAKIYTKGAGLVQVTGLGMDKESVPFTQEGFIMSDEDRLGINFRYAKNQDGTVDRSKVLGIESLDCYYVTPKELRMFAEPDGSIPPWKLRKLVKNGIIDERTLLFYGYRTPSDAEHSTLPLRVKGFLPPSAGCSIIISKEAMVMTGHDYDGDKFRCHFQEFRVTTDYDRIRRDYRNNPSWADASVLEDLFGEELKGVASDNYVDEDDFMERVKHLPKNNKFKQRYATTHLIEYDYSKSPFEGKNTDPKARKNALIQLLIGALTSESGSMRMVIPGGAAETDKIAKTFQVMKMLGSNYANTSRMLLEAKFPEEMIKKKDYIAIYNRLLKMDADDRDALIDEINSMESPFSFAHQCRAYRYMMTGTQMTGIYAMYSSTAALLQRLHLRYIPKVRKGGPAHVRLFGKEIGDMFKIQYGPDGNPDPLQLLILAELVNAAVDNGKNPILGFLNQTPELSSMTFFLYSVGLSAEEIHLMMNQPSIIELADRLKKRDSKGFKLEVYRMIEELKEMTMKDPSKGFSHKIAIDNFSKEKGTDKYVMGLVQNYSDLKDASHKAVAKFNLGLLCTLYEFADAADQLTTFVHVVRPESRSAGAGPTVAKTIVRLAEADDLRNLVTPKEENADEDADYKELRISGMEPVLEERDIHEGMSSEAIVNEIERGTERSGQLRQATALHYLLIRHSLDYMARYFPQAKENWRDYIVRLAKEHDYSSLQDGTVENIGDDMLLYALLDSQKYRRDLEGRRKDLVIDMPLRLDALLDRINAERTRDPKENPNEDTLARELADNIFLRKLGVRRPEGAEDAPRIYFDAGGPMIGYMAEDIRQAWAELVEHPNKEIRKLATELFEYNLFTSGVSFGRYEFSHLAPLNAILRTPHYVDALYSVMSYKWDDEKFENFRHQYYMNHWGERRLVPHFSVENLSADALQLLGITGEPDTSAQAISGDNILEQPYLVIEDKDGNQNLYRQVKTKDEKGVKFESAQKLGVRTSHGQMSVQYNPQMMYYDMKPIQVGLDSNWGGEEQLANNAPKWKKYNRKKAADAAEYKASVDASVEKRSEATLEEKLANSPVPVFNTEMRDAAEKKNEAMNEADKKNGEDLDKAKEDGSMPKGLPGPKFFSLLKTDSNGNSVVEDVPATPGNVQLARRQRVQVQLNNRLREILRQHGVNVGALTDAEIRMGIAGIADFDTAEVTANGLVDMIRLANGYVGENALPEEFAHVAIEMLGRDHVLVQRLFNAVGRSDAGLREAFAGQYDQYMQAYGNDRQQMVVEAAGKLVAKHLLRQQKIETNFLYRIVARVGDAIKALFRRFSVNEIHNAIYDANNIASNLARNLLSGRIATEMNRENINVTGKLYNKVKEDISGQEGILSKLLKYEMKRLSHLEARIQDKEDDPSIEATKGQIEALRDSIRKHKTDSAVLSYLDSTVGFLTKTEQELNAILDHKLEVGTNTICKHLTNVVDTIYSFSKAMSDIKQAMKDGEISSSPSINDLIQQIETGIRSFYERCNNLGMEYFEDFLSEMYGEHGLVQTIGRQRGRKISIKEMAARGDRDISMASRWLHSLSDCNDLVLKAVAEKVARAKYDARSKTLEIKREVDVAFANLVRETGSRDQSFMFEMKRYDGGTWCGGREDDGKLHKTGKFIKREVAKERLTPAQFEFYTKMRELKEKADKLLPDSKVSDLKIIMLRKKAIEKAMDSDNVKSKAKYVFEEIRDKVLDMSDDAMSDTYEVQMGFDGSRVDRLPVLYCEKSPRESYDDMTDDVATAVMAYTSMANEYSELDNIVGMIENAKRMSSMRDIGKRSGLRSMRETISDEEQIFHSPYTVKQATTYIQAALDDFVTMHVYGHIRKDEGTIPHTRISKRALVDTANSLASLSQMALNIPQRISNITVGQAQIIIESAAKGMFRAKDVRWAAGQYAKYSADRLVEVGKIDSDNFLTLWIDHFDVGQDNRRSFKQDKYGRSRLGRNANSSLLYAGLTIGEDYLSSVTSLALGHQFQVKHKEGNKEIVGNLVDAYEVAYTDPKNKTGAYLKLKDGYTKMDGSAITKEDEYRFARQVNALNFDMQGIYNLDDRSAIQQYCGGALLIMYRKWIAPALKRRYAGVHYDALRGQWEQGYWNTTFDYIYDTIKSMKDDGESLVSAINLNWEKLTDYEKGNIRKAGTESGIYIGTLLLVGALDLLDSHRKQAPDDDEPMTWFEKMVLYQALRLRNELGAQAPTPALISEAGKILKSPMAAARPLVTVIDGYHLLLPQSYFETVPSGRYKGHTKAYKYFWDLPGLNMLKHIENVKDPSYQIRYYQNKF